MGLTKAKKLAMYSHFQAIKDIMTSEQRIEVAYHILELDQFLFSKSKNTPLLQLLFPNMQEGDTVSSMTVLHRLRIGFPAMQQYIKKWEEKGVVVEYNSIRDDYRLMKVPKK